MRILSPIVLCALARRIVLPGGIRAGKLSLQPEAIGADQEATNDLKPSDEGCTKYVRDGEAFLKADFVAEAGVGSLLCLKSANS